MLQLSMAVLKLSLLGPFTAAFDDTHLESIGTVKAQALLIYLAVEKERPHRREQLFTLLWPGMPEKSARHNLRQVLYELRKSFLGISALNVGDPEPLLLSDRQTVQLNPEAAVEVDFHRMLSLVRGTKNHPHDSLENCDACKTALENAVELYRGDFLQDFYLEDSNQFEDWAQAVREKCRGHLFDALKIITEIYIGNREHDKALEVINRGLTIDNLRESTHRHLLLVYEMSGRRVEALRHYREYSQLLESELDIAPSKAITALYERIRGEDLVEVKLQLAREPKEVSPPRHNLVPQLTPFIGREAELAKLDDMLGNEDTRLITITGPGGMGKTRLAIACAERQFHRMVNGVDSGRVGSSRSTPVGEQTHPYKDGIFFIPLGDINDPAKIPNEIVKALNLPFSSGVMGSDWDPVQQQLLGYFQGKKLLLVMDNFEQLLKGSVILNEILQVAKEVQLLVTSRERLHLQSEQAFPIDGLEFPDWEAPEDPGDYTAMQLFLESARRVRPDFEFKLGDMIHLTRICRLVGGMPLGLELAASWVDMLSVMQIAEEIQKGIEFLETDVRDLPERHRSLQAVCTSTWAHLIEPEQLIFARLSIFLGSFTQEAAQEVASASIRVLSALRRKSLLQYDPENERFWIHPYLRQYAQKRLGELPQDRVQTHERHCDYFSSFVEKYANIFYSGNYQYAYMQMDKEIANILAAWEWAVENEQIASLAQALDGLSGYFTWNYRGQETLSICRQANQVLTRFELPSGSVQSPVLKNVGRVHGTALNYLGYHTFLYDRDQASLFFDQSAEILQELEIAGFDTRFEKAQLLRFRAKRIKRFVSAKPLLVKSIALSEEINDFWGIFECYGIGHSWAMSTGDFQEAINWSERGLLLAQSQKNLWQEIIFQILLGEDYRSLRNYTESKKYFITAFEKASVCGYNRLMALAKYYLGNLLIFLGDLEGSKNYYLESARIAEDSRYLIKADSFAGFSVSCWLAGKFEEAEKSLLEALYIRSDPKYQSEPGMNIYLILLYILSGQYSKAENIIDHQDDWSRGLNLQHFIYNGFFKMSVGVLALVANDATGARMKFLESIEIIKKSVGSLAAEWSGWVQAFLVLGEFVLGKPDQAKKILIKALSKSIDIQGYIPMVFNLPMTLLILADENPTLAAEVYQQVRRDPFLGKAQLYHDLVYNHLPDEITSIPVKTVETSPEHREGLWAAARKVLAAWEGEEE